MYNVEINSTDEIKFLGYRFDRYMSFNNQMSYIKTAVRSRLSILKILSHPTCQLKPETLCNIGVKERMKQLLLNNRSLVNENPMFMVLYRDYLEFLKNPKLGPKLTLNILAPL